MQKKLLLLFFILSSSLLAVEDTSLLSDDASVAKSSRKTVFGLSEMGLEQTQYTFDVTYCPSGKDAKCRAYGHWDANIDQNYADRILDDEYKMLISNRYDKLLVDKYDIQVITPMKDVKTKYTSKDMLFNFDIGSKREFSDAVLRYLNSAFAAKMQKALSSAADLKYAQMSESEVETFINTQAKELAIPAPMLKKLMESSYAFALYLPKIVGSMTIYQHEHKTNNGTYYTYSLSLNAPLSPYLVIYKFDGEQYKPYKVVDTDIHGFDIGGALAKSSSGSSSISTGRSMPREADAQKVFDEVFRLSFKDSVIALSTRLKEDREFAVTAPVTEGGFFNFKVDMGVQEDIRHHHPVKLYRTNLDGEEESVGWAKVDNVGHNCMLSPRKTQSEAYLITGTAEEGDLVVEIPYTGVFWGLDASLIDNRTYVSKGISKAYVDNEDQSRPGHYYDLSGFGAMKYVGVSNITDNAYFYNTDSHWWTRSTIFLGTTSGSLDENISKLGTSNDDAFTLNSGYALKVEYGFKYRLDIIWGLYFGAELPISVEYMMNDLSNKQPNNNPDENWNMRTFIAQTNPNAQLGIQFGPHFEIHGGVGYDYPFFLYQRVGDGVKDSKYSETLNSDVTGGMNIIFGASYALDFAGGGADDYARPSSECNRLKALQR